MRVEESLEFVESITRRNAVKVLASAAAVGALAACGSDTPTDMSEANKKIDIEKLNVLLGAEYGAVAAYTAGAGILMSPPAGDAAASLAPTVLAVAGRFAGQHSEHALAIKATIEAMGGTPVSSNDYPFTAPDGFTPGVINVMKLAANAEKAAAVAYNATVKALTLSGNRYLAAIIEGDETQHYIVLHTLLKGYATVSTSVNVEHVVPRAFVAATDDKPGLETVANL